MQQVQQRVMEALQTLSPLEQQEVLDFVEFLQSRQKKQNALEIESEQEKSVLELAGDLVGCLEGGPSDLSTNKRYFEGFGEE